MKVKALISFSGLFSMTLNEVTDIEDSDILDDLLQAGFIEEIPIKQNDEIPVVTADVILQDAVGTDLKPDDDVIEDEVKFNEGIGTELSDG